MWLLEYCTCAEGEGFGCSTRLLSAHLCTFFILHTLYMLNVVYSFLCTVGRTCAPRIPRVLLLGPTGSGKSLQAAQLARAYQLVEVDCKFLIKQALASGSKLALTMKPFHDRGMLSKMTASASLSLCHLSFLYMCMIYVCSHGDGSYKLPRSYCDDAGFLVGEGRNRKCFTRSHP